MALTSTGFTGEIAKTYIPALNAVNAPAGLKVLMLAHTVVEGFFPGSVAYRTNNPGNIGTDTSKNVIRKFPTLSEGIAAQIRQKELILDGKSKYYKPDFTLIKYLTTYAPPPQNNPTAYLASVINTFKKQGYNVTGLTTFRQIANIGGDLQKKKSNGVFGGGLFGGLSHFIFGA